MSNFWLWGGMGCSWKIISEILRILNLPLIPRARLLLMQARPLTVQAPQQEEIQSRNFQKIRRESSSISGTVACFGAASGPVFIIRKDEDLINFPEGSILVARHTSARYGMVLAQGPGNGH